MRSRSRELEPRSSWPPSRDCARSIETPPIEPNPPPSSPERSAVPASSDCVRDIGTPAIGGGSEVGPLEPPDPPPAAGGAAGFDAPAEAVGTLDAVEIPLPLEPPSGGSTRPSSSSSSSGPRLPERSRSLRAAAIAACVAGVSGSPGVLSMPFAREIFRSRCRLFWNHTCTCRGDTLSFRASSRRVSRPANAEEAERRAERRGGGSEGDVGRAARRVAGRARRGRGAEKRPRNTIRRFSEGGAARAWEWVHVVHLFEHAE